MGEESARIDATVPVGRVVYIYPLVASIFVLVAVVALCSACKKKKTSKYKNPPSVVQETVQEEVIQAQTTDQVKSLPLVNNHLVTEDEVLKEDQDIFKSYMNLRFIDETEESTKAQKRAKL